MDSNTAREAVVFPLTPVKTEAQDKVIEDPDTPQTQFESQAIDVDYSDSDGDSCKAHSSLDPYRPDTAAYEDDADMLPTDSQADIPPPLPLDKFCGQPEALHAAANRWIGFGYNGVPITDAILNQASSDQHSASNNLAEWWSHSSCHFPPKVRCQFNASKTLEDKLFLIRNWMRKLGGHSQRIDDGDEDSVDSSMA